VSLPANFRASIQALETADIVKVHSTPQIATINGNQASITIGETRYYKMHKETRAATTNQDNLIGTDERFEQQKFDTKLEVTPWVMDSGYVMVKIRPEFNIPRSGGSDDRPPTVDSRVLESMVRLRNGQTIVLGGQRQTEKVLNSRGVPYLSSIPILGWLFSNKTWTNVETQMMIFLTPRVYYGNEAEVKPDDYFGSEVNKMLDEKDPDKKKQERIEKRKQRHEKWQEKKSARAARRHEATTPPESGSSGTTQP
jgi:type IV pilus assembly protein PilQ